MTIRWEAFGGSDIGRVRERNEDAFRLDERRGIFLVADGMGGHAAGEVASRIAADAAFASLSAPTSEGIAPETRLRAAFEAAYEALAEATRADRSKAGMGTTLIVLLLSPDGALHIGHLGDCRVYRSDGDQLQQLTTDHTWVQQEVEAGRLSEIAARHHPRSHLLTRVLIAEGSWEPDLLRSTAHAGELFLICSDGLHTMLEADELQERLRSGAALPIVLEALIGGANAAGGSDNSTALLIRIC